MSVIYKVVTRPSDPRVPNSPKKYYPHLDHFRSVCQSEIYCAENAGLFFFIYR